MNNSLHTTYTEQVPTVLGLLLIYMPIQRCATLKKYDIVAQ